MGVPVLEARGTEADDCIGTLAATATRLGFAEVLVSSPDKDFMQLLALGEGSGTRVTLLRSGGTSAATHVNPFTIDDFRAKFPGEGHGDGEDDKKERAAAAAANRCSRPQLGTGSNPPRETQA